MRVLVDEQLCTGCELCVDTCFDVYEIGEDGLSHVLLDPVPDEYADCAREAASICPVAAISVED